MPETTTYDDNIFVSLSNSYHQLTASEKKVADYVLNHRSDAQFMSITELADECGVAEATISRFCRRMNLQGYNGFKLALAKQNAREEAGVVTVPATGVLREKSADEIMEVAWKQYAEYTSALGQTISLIDSQAVSETVDLLESAHRVYCMGQGGSMIIAMQAAHLFSTVSPDFFTIQDSHLQVSAVSLMTEGDVILFFSYSGSTKDIVDIMTLAKERGIKIILITRFARSPGAALADIILQCGSREGPLELSSVSASISQLFLVDILYQEMCRRNPAETTAHKEQIAGALANKHL